MNERELITNHKKAVKNHQMNALTEQLQYSVYTYITNATAQTDTNTKWPKVMQLQRNKFIIWRTLATAGSWLDITDDSHGQLKK
jgi:hypothetical protein